MESRRILFEKLGSVSNPNSMHGIYPYRGKISALDAKNIIKQFESGKTLLDPFCGSGTIVYEGLAQGLNTIGVDNNPLAVTIAKAKIYRGAQQSIIDEATKFINDAKEDLKSNNFEQMPAVPLAQFHVNTAKEIMCLKNYYEEMNDFLKGIFYGTIALVARGCNNYVWTSSTVGKPQEIKRYINFFEKFEDKLNKHKNYLLNNHTNSANVILGDSRKLSDFIPLKSIDYIFTSPPYFDGLDYTAYYGKLIYDIFGVNRQSIQKTLIQHIDNYREDMKLVLDEIDKITTDNALVIFVVGDKKIKGTVVNGGDFFSEIKKASYVEERSYSGSQSKVFDAINKTDRKEQIVVWDKQGGKIVEYERR